MQIVSNETICMYCQIMFSGKNKKNITNLSSAELTQRDVKVKVYGHILKRENRLWSVVASLLKGRLI